MIGELGAAVNGDKEQVIQKASIVVVRVLVDSTFLLSVLPRFAREVFVLAWVRIREQCRKVAVNLFLLVADGLGVRRT